jgi:hypothetical protein
MPTTYSSNGPRRATGRFTEHAASADSLRSAALGAESHPVGRPPRMKHPRNLVPSGFESSKLDDGRAVEIPKATPRFAIWTGPSSGGNYGGKAILDFNGRPAFAELAILWSFMEAGWDGVWLDNFGSRHLRGFWPTPLPTELPAEQRALIERIESHAPGKAKPWDVFCWSPEGVLFAEAKRHGKDSIRPGQTAFLGAGFAAGLPSSSFLLVEWDLA